MRRSIVTSSTDSLPSRTRVRGIAAPLALAAAMAGCSAGSGEDNFNPSGGSSGSGEATSTGTATDAAASATGSSASSGTGSAGSMSGSSSGTATDPTAGTGTAGTTASSAASTSASGSDTDVRFDVGVMTGASGASGIDTQEDGCKKVDVILASDGSDSMTEELDALRGPVFNTLPMQLLSVGNGGIEDFHLALIDGCPKPGTFHDYGASGPCTFSTGANYMTSSSPNLVSEFDCVGNVEISDPNDNCDDESPFGDDDEQPALAAAVSLTDPGNPGFLRSDAILFVFAVTDEDEELDGNSTVIPDEGLTAADVAQRMIDGKGGRAQDIVFLGVGGASDCNGPYGGANNARELQNIVTELNARGARASFWDLCQGDLPGAFASVIQDVDQACDEFVPPG